MVGAAPGSVKTDFPKMVEQYRNAAIRNGIATSHPRAPEIYAKPCRRR